MQRSNSSSQRSQQEGHWLSEEGLDMGKKARDVACSPVF